MEAIMEVNIELIMERLHKNMNWEWEKFSKQKERDGNCNQ